MATTAGRLRRVTMVVEHENVRQRATALQRCQIMLVDGGDWPPVKSVWLVDGGDWSLVKSVWSQ